MSLKNSRIGCLVFGVVAVVFGINAQAADEPRHAKDIVLAPLAAQAATPVGAMPQTMAPRYDGMAVSVLVENADGTLIPKGVDGLFQTGQRFRIKIFAPRDGDVLVYNTNPQGITSQTPIWKTSVRAGLETISEPFLLTGNRGEDQLHVVLQPKEPPSQGVFSWFQNLFASNTNKSTKDIQLVTENTPQTTYFYNTNSQGGYVTIRFRHQ